MLKAKTYIGQHFLTDEALLERIAKQIPVNSLCIEIGAGQGALTKQLLKNHDQVIAYEIDVSCKAELDILAKTGNLKIIWKNFLDEPINNINSIKNYFLVGNIPYNISEPLLFKLINLQFEYAILLVGKRLADTITTKDPKHKYWSRLSMLSEAYFNIEVLKGVPRDLFNPVPKSDGVLIKITHSDAKDVVAKSYRAIVDADRQKSTVAKALKSVAFIKNQNVYNQICDKVEEKLLSKLLSNISNQDLKLIANAIIGLK